MTVDRRAHLADPDLYRAFYEKDQQPGVIMPMRRDEPRLRWVLEHVGSGDDVIDVGCHKGEMTIAVWGVTTGRVVGVDISANAITHARQLAERERLDIAYECAAAEALPFRDASFDVAVLCEILEHVADPATVLAEAERVVRPGGTVVLSVPVDALANDAEDAKQRDAATGFALDMHVREYRPDLELKDKSGFEFALGVARMPEGYADMGFRMAAYRAEK